MSGIMLANMSYKPAVVAGTPSIITTHTTLSNASIAANSPFAGGGNSYLFNGTSTSYATVAPNSNFNFGTGDFTFEWFQYETDTNNFPRVFWYISNTFVASWGMSLEIATPYWWPNGSPVSLGSLGTFKNVWVHFALVKINGRLYFYKNGTLISTAGGVVNSTSLTNTTNTLYIGAKAGGLASEQFAGYITSFRIVKGLGVYTGNFTTPTSALTATQSAGTNISAIADGQTIMLLNP